MKIIKIILIVLVIEIAVFFILGKLTLNNYPCNYSENPYWRYTTKPDPNTVISCTVDTGPTAATLSSKVEFDTLIATLVLIPLTAVTGLAISFMKDKR